MPKRKKFSLYDKNLFVELEKAIAGESHPWAGHYITVGFVRDLFSFLSTKPLDDWGVYLREMMGDYHDLKGGNILYKEM